MSDFRGEFEDAFNLLCCDKLGEGMSRTVYLCELLPDCVVKVETRHSTFQNILEWRTWQTVEYTENAKWFAPCRWISPNGTILIQDRTYPTDPTHLPRRMPAWFTDFKIQNYGFLSKPGRTGPQLVCHDYGTSLALQEGTATRRMRAPVWYDGVTGAKLKTTSNRRPMKACRPKQDRT